MIRFHDVKHQVDRDSASEYNACLPDMPGIKILHRFEGECFETGVFGCHGSHQANHSFPVAGERCEKLVRIENVKTQVPLALDSAVSAAISSSVGLLYVGGPSYLLGLGFLGPIGLTAAALTGVSIGVMQYVLGKDANKRDHALIELGKLSLLTQAYDGVLTQQHAQRFRNLESRVDKLEGAVQELFFDYARALDATQGVPV